MLGFIFHSFSLISSFLSDYLTRGLAEPHSFPRPQKGYLRWEKKIGKNTWVKPQELFWAFKKQNEWNNNNEESTDQHHRKLSAII